MPNVVKLKIKFLAGFFHNAPIRCNRDGIEQPTKGETGGIEFFAIDIE